MRDYVGDFTSYAIFVIFIFITFASVFLSLSAYNHIFLQHLRQQTAGISRAVFTPLRISALFLFSDFMLIILLVVFMFLSISSRDIPNHTPLPFLKCL